MGGRGLCWEGGWEGGMDGGRESERVGAGEDRVSTSKRLRLRVQVVEMVTHPPTPTHTHVHRDTHAPRHTFFFLRERELDWGSE